MRVSQSNLLKKSNAVEIIGRSSIITALFILFLISYLPFLARASSDNTPFGDRLRGIVESLEIWEEIVRRDYSIKEEKIPLKKTSSRYRKLVLDAIKPHRIYIEEASRLFNVPKSIIGGLIYMESSGRANAIPIGNNDKILSSAKGLTQIVDKTFREIQTDLKNKEINGEKISIGRDRTDPRTAIIAGTYYLSKQFNYSIKDTGLKLTRDRMGDWCMALKYYYSGRSSLNGTHYEKKFIYSDGSESLDPEKYCQRVLRYASILAQYG